MNELFAPDVLTFVSWVRRWTVCLWTLNVQFTVWFVYVYVVQHILWWVYQVF